MWRWRWRLHPLLVPPLQFSLFPSSLHSLSFTTTRFLNTPSPFVPTSLLSSTSHRHSEASYGVGYPPLILLALYSFPAALYPLSSSFYSHSLIPLPLPTFLPHFPRLPHKSCSTHYHLPPTPLSTFLSPFLIFCHLLKENCGNNV